MSKSVFEKQASPVQIAEMIMASRRGWSGPIGMSMIHGAGENQSGQGGGDSGNGQQSAGAGLLDDEANQGAGDAGDNGDAGQGDGSGQQRSGDQGGQQSGQADEQALMQRVESMLDRRINQAVNTITQRLGAQGGGNGQQNDQGNGGGQGGEQNGGGQQSGGGQAQQTGVSASDAREGRMVYREYVTDEIKFLGNEERDFAQTLAGGLLRERLERGDDPEVAGRAVAKDVAKQLKTLRGHYETKVLAALRRQGKIPAEVSGPGHQPPPGSSAPGAGSGFQKGKDRATSLYADRMPQQS